MKANDHYTRFGEVDSFALDVRFEHEPDPSAPLTSIGSWGSWRLWVAGLNLCEFEFVAAVGPQRVDCTRWYLAPLFRWISTNWAPLLHESRLPAGAPALDVRPREARTTYLGQLRKIGDDDRFGPWQTWAQRHALRAAAEGGIVPDVFFQRVGDEVEVSWGDRITPGGETVSFVLEPGSRVPRPIASETYSRMRSAGSRPPPKLRQHPGCLSSRSKKRVEKPSAQKPASRGSWMDARRPRR